MGSVVHADDEDLPGARVFALRIRSPQPPIDTAGAEQAVRLLLIALGQDPDSEHLRQTPRRVAAAYTELLRPSAVDLTTFPNGEGYDQLVLARDIPFHRCASTTCCPSTV